MGRRLRAMLDADGSVSRGRHNIKFFASPFLRTQQTVEGILDAFPQARMSPVRYDPRLRECEFGRRMCAPATAASRQATTYTLDSVLWIAAMLLATQATCKTQMK